MAACAIERPGSPGDAGRTSVGLQRRDWIVLAGLIAAVAWIIHNAPMRSFATQSDPRGILLTSQALLQHGSLRLDPYLPLNYRVRQHTHGGHSRYNDALGTSVLAAPCVFAANAAGLDMRDPDTDARVQGWLSTASVLASVLLLYLVSRRFLGTADSAVLAAAFALGTSVASTMGTALWNVDFEVVLLLAVLWLMLKRQACELPGTGWTLALAGMAFAAYVCRPTAAVFIAAMLLFQWLENRRDFWRIAFVLGALASVFVLFSWNQYGRLLPPYYAPQRLAARLSAGTGFWKALYGVLASPSRGLLIYSAFVVMPLAGVAVYARSLLRDRWVLFGLAWFALHLLMVSRFGGWWGGWCFGPRVLTDALPALFLLSVLGWRHARRTLAPAALRVLVALFACLAAWSVFIHSRAGLYNTWTARWNAVPNIDKHPSLLFDWRHPQFLASPRGLSERLKEHEARLAKPGKDGLGAKR